MSYSFKLFVFAGLFAALCFKGGELCSARGVDALAELVSSRSDEQSVKEFAPLKPREEEFRGISPWPDLAARLPLPKRVER